MRTRRELVEFVASLPLSEERREVVQMELEDHLFEGIAELEASGVPTADAERRSVESLGDPAELRTQLIEAQLAVSITPPQAAMLGARAGLLFAAVSLFAGYLDVDPPPLCYLVFVVAMLLAWPRNVIRPFLAARRRAIAARLAGNPDAEKRLQEPAANFLGALLATASSLFFSWLVAIGIGFRLGPMEGPLVRTVLAAFLVTMMTVTAASIFLLGATFSPARRSGRAA
jgi:hypothetical protein